MKGTKARKIGSHIVLFIGFLPFLDFETSVATCCAVGVKRARLSAFLVARLLLSWPDISFVLVNGIRGVSMRPRTVAVDRPTNGIPVIRRLTANSDVTVDEAGLHLDSDSSGRLRPFPVPCAEARLNGSPLWNCLTYSSQFYRTSDVSVPLLCAWDIHGDRVALIQKLCTDEVGTALAPLSTHPWAWPSGAFLLGVHPYLLVLRSDCPQTC